MDVVVSVAFGLLRLIFPVVIFAGIGWASIWIVTFGRYPAHRPQWKHVDDLEALALLGGLEVIVIGIALACFLKR